MHAGLAGLRREEKNPFGVRRQVPKGKKSPFGVQGTLLSICLKDHGYQIKQEE